METIYNILNDNKDWSGIEEVKVNKQDVEKYLWKNKPLNRYCNVCSHGVAIGYQVGLSCEILNAYFNSVHNVKNFIDPCGMVARCECYDRVDKFNYIRSKDEMIDFIKRTINFFGCVENWEYYYGFSLQYDDDGECVQTLEEYVKNNGEFKNIPKQYPAVIVFNYGDDDVYEMEYFELPKEHQKGDNQ